MNRSVDPACYVGSLQLCRDHGITSISFPSISTGAYGYPLELAAPVALSAVVASLRSHGDPALCRFVLFNAETLGAYQRAAPSLEIEAEAC